MSIPLVQEATKDAINTSIIAIKRNIERVNMLLGLVDSGGNDPDLSGLATKQELQDAITELTPVDEVTLNNMQSVTSNAVAEAGSYSTEEHFTGMYWFDGKKIYEKSYKCTTSFGITTTWQTINSYFNGLAADIPNIDSYIKCKLKSSKKYLSSGFWSHIENGNLSIVNWTSGWNVSTTDGYLTIQYTKTNN